MRLKSDKVVITERVHAECKQRHSDLTGKIDNARTVQASLDKKVQDLNDRWVAKRMMMTHYVNEVRGLSENMSDIKLKRRKRLEEQRKRAKVENVQANQQRNYAKNVNY